MHPFARASAMTLRVRREPRAKLHIKRSAKITPVAMANAEPSAVNRVEPVVLRINSVMLPPSAAAKNIQIMYSARYRS